MIKVFQNKKLEPNQQIYTTLLLKVELLIYSSTHQIISEPLESVCIILGTAYSNRKVDVRALPSWHESLWWYHTIYTFISSTSGDLGSAKLLKNMEIK